jgi:hypothetical protein
MHRALMFLGLAMLQWTHMILTPIVTVTYSLIGTYEKGRPLGALSRVFNGKKCLFKNAYSKVKLFF